MTQDKHGHPAAAILREIAEVAEWHPEFWREFEYWNPYQKKWILCDCIEKTAWQGSMGKLRRKPRTRRIGSFDVPLPEREAPEVGAEYWVADPESPQYCFSCPWGWDEIDQRRLERGLVHLDPDSAKIHGRALASLMSAEDGELMPREDEE